MSPLTEGEGAAKHVGSVESDSCFMEAVQARISPSAIIRIEFDAIYVDIGKTGPWGSSDSCIACMEKRRTLSCLLHRTVG